MARLNSKKALEARDPDIAAMGDYWQTVDDIMKGVEAMIERHLPPLPHETADDYKLRSSVIKMSNVFDDIVEGLVAKPFTHDVTFTTSDKVGTPPENITDWSENIDGAGSNLTQFAERTFRAGVSRAVAFILVDSPVASDAIRTRADELKAGIRPYWSNIHPSNMCAIRVVMVNSAETLSYVRYVEPTTPKRVREYERNEITGKIVWRLWKLRDDKARAKVDEEYELENDGILGIDEIPVVPFATGERQGRTFEYRPTLKKITELQVDLFQDESGLKWIKRLAAYPMLTGNGITPPKDQDGKPKPILTGPNRTLYTPPDGNGKSGSWAWVEPSTNNMKFLAEEIETTKNTMRELGNQPLSPSGDTGTRVQATQSASKSNSTVKRWAGALRDALENATVIACKFASIAPETYDPTVFVFDDFDVFDRTDDLEVLTTDRKNGDLSQLTMWEERKRRGVYGPDFTADREIKRLLAESSSREEPDVDAIEPPPVDDVTPPNDKEPPVQE